MMLKEPTESRWATLAEIFALVLLLLAVWAAIAGGFHLTIGPLRISATSWARLAMEAAVVLVLRYALVPAIAPARTVRGRFVLAYILLLVALACSSTQRRLGDGGEYLALALNLALLHPPAISDTEMRDIEQTFAGIGGTFQDVPLVNPDSRGRDGRQDLPTSGSIRC